MSLQLTPAEARVIAALVEKSFTTPQYYPMTVNAIRLACNQKSSREPVMNLTDGEVGAALNALEGEGCCTRDTTSGRAQRWRHSFQHALTLDPGPMAVLVMLMLRGPQTLAELRARAAGIGGPGDAVGVETALNDLLDRAQPLVSRQPRGRGQKEDRWVHRLCGEAATPNVVDPPVTMSASPAPEADVDARVTKLEQRLASLEQRIADLESGRHRG